MSYPCLTGADRRPLPLKKKLVKHGQKTEERKQEIKATKSSPSAGTRPSFTSGLQFITCRTELRSCSC